MLGSDLVGMMPGRFDVAGIDVEDADITQFKPLRRAVLGHDPDFIVHCAAYTDVDGCERNADLSYLVNAVGTRNVAGCAAELDIPILYISTDFVFDGRCRKPYREYDTPRPVNEYGYTKLAGEFFVRSLHDKFFIVRTAWLYGMHGRNFVDTILDIADREGRLRVVDDQVGSPTYTRDLAKKVMELIEEGAGYGVYHVTNSGCCSWFDFARKILGIAGREGVSIEAITTEESGRAARRPANSVLDNRAIRLEGLKPLRPWEEALADYLGNRSIHLAERGK